MRKSRADSGNPTGFLTERKWKIMRRILLLVMVALIVAAMAVATAAPAFAAPPDTEKARELCIKQFEAGHSWPPWCADLFLAG
jgi:hypothetical protein